MEEETLIPQPEDEGDQAMADLPQPSNPDSPPLDSDSDSGPHNDEALDNLQLQNFETDLAANPSNYDSHAQYIKLLRKMGDLEKLRRAREVMSELFPLTPSMWQDWARDEASLITAGTEEFPAIEKLYERGLSDYLSPSLWHDYLEFVQDYDQSVRECSQSGIAKARGIFERAITSSGLHVGEGNKIWEAYREFEQAIFHTIDETNIQGKDKQIQRIRSIFHRQLSVPHVNMRSTLLSYKAWEVEQGSMLEIDSSDLDGISSHVAAAYQKAVDMYNARTHHEEKISGKDLPDVERFQEFMNYLKFEQSSGDPTRVQVLYERAVTDFPVSMDLWLDYTRYLDKTLKVGSIVTGVYSRAVKNCPWVSELWVRYLLCLERNRASETEISAVFEKSLQCTFSNIEEYLNLFLTRVDGLRRRILFTNDVDNLLDFSLIRETFQNASDYLAPHMKNTYSFLQLHAYWARLELNLGKDLVASRGILENSLKNCGLMLEAWQGYIAVEIELGHTKEARSLYKRCYSKRFSGTGSEMIPSTPKNRLIQDICHSWLRFEREYGTLEDFFHAELKVSSRLEELQLLRSREESKLAEEQEAVPKKNVREKRKPVSSIDDEHHPPKRQKEAKKLHEKEVALVQNKVEENKVEMVKAQVEERDTEKKEQTKDSSQEGRFYTDQRTVFVSNLNFKANSEDLLKFFDDVGGVVGIRLLHDKFTGKSRGLAYVEFSDNEHVEAAVAKNRQTLLGKKLSIAKSNPKHGKQDKSDQNRPREQGKNYQTHLAGGSSSDLSTKSDAPHEGPQINARKPRVENIQLMGKNTFAVPRNVSVLNPSAKKPKTDEEGDEKPKSNDEFRKMFIKGENL